jgi:poly(3-hydroxyalkanoate) depolymerase
MTSELRHAGGRRLLIDVRSGDGSLPPLLLLNGIGAPMQLLQPFVDALNARREVIRLDVPGVGGSPTPRIPYSMGLLAWSVSRALDQLRHDRVDVMGYSWGGALAQHLALQHPHRCRRLVLAATGMGVTSVPGRPHVMAHMASPRRHRDGEYANRVAAEIYGGSMRTNPELARQLLNPGPSTRTRRGYYFQLAAAGVWSSLPWLPLIRQETLVIAGNDDPLIPTINPKVMAALIRRSQLHIFDGGHLELLSAASGLAPVVEVFLDRRA